ncbi:MAG: metalloregulator ArsR/SmtB family transcription factor [Ilumatobacteraceae bacterium]
MFRLLGDPTRVRILFALLEAGELCVCEIAAVVDTSDTKVSQAMRLLRGAGVVRNRRAGRNIHYRLDDDHVRLLLELSREHCSHGLDDR